MTTGMGGSSPCASMPDQPPLPGDTKQAIIISLIVMSGVLIIGFAACRRHDISGRHVGGQGNGRRWPSHTDQGPVSSVMLLRG